MIRLAGVVAIAATLVGVPAMAAETPPKILKYVQPVIPQTANETLKEGIVRVELAISAEGDVTDAKIVESYPKGVYDAAVLAVAKSWKFQPRMKDGVPVADPSFDHTVAFYSDLYETNRNNSQRSGSVRGVSQANINAFRDGFKALDENNLKAAGTVYEELKKRFDAGSMSVTDVARYYAFVTRYDRLSGKYEEALSAANTTLGLAQFLDNGNVVFGIHLERLATLAALNRNDAAVDYYDSWRKVAKLPIPKSIVDYIEELRAKGFGKGHAYFIVDFDETHKRTNRNRQY